MKTFHLPGIKNELCDLMSRQAFNEQFQIDFEDLAKTAFQRMDFHLDLFMQKILGMVEWTKDHYLPEYSLVWNALTPRKSRTY